MDMVALFANKVLLCKVVQCVLRLVRTKWKYKSMWIIMDQLLQIGHVEVSGVVVALVSIVGIAAAATCIFSNRRPKGLWWMNESVFTLSALV